MSSSSLFFKIVFQYSELKYFGKRNMKRISLVILISLLFLSMLNTGLLSQEKKNSTFKYTKISSFEIKLTNSTTIGLQDYTNKPIVLNWGASWCPICKANLVTMNNIYDSAKPYFNFYRK